MCYPLAVDGAFFLAGDPHAAQGDSELGGTAIETSLTGDFEFILHKKRDLGGDGQMTPPAQAARSSSSAVAREPLRLGRRQRRPASDRARR